MSDTNQGVRGLEFWGGDVTGKNIGPATGERFLGKVDDPGLYFFIAPNTSGKSHYLSLLSKLQKQRLLRADSDISDGELSASLRFGLASVTFRRLPTGELLDPVREGTEALPRIESLPLPIDILLNKAPGVKGEQERLRARLEALLTYAPVPSTDELVLALCGALAGRVFETDPGPEKRALWEALTARAKDRTKRLRVEPLRTSTEIAAWLIGQDRESILDDHGHLVDILNATGNLAEKNADLQAEAVAAAGGQVKEAIEAAARRLQAQPDATLEAALRERADQPDPEAMALTIARMSLAGLQAEAKSRAAEEQRREGLRAKQAKTKPDAGPALKAVEAARQAVETSALVSRKAGEELAAAVRSLEEAGPRATEARGAVHAAWNELDDTWGDFNRLFAPLGADSGFIVPSTAGKVAEVRSQGDVIKRRTDRLVELVEASLRDVIAESVREKAVAEASNKHDSALQVEADDKLAARARQAELDAVTAQVEAWTATDALLAQAVPGPSDQDVEEAQALVSDLERDQVLATAAGDVRRASAARDAEEQKLIWLQTLAGDLRTAAQDSWKFLGAVVTQALALPWLRVDGLRIMLRYDGAGSGAHLVTSDDQVVDVRDLDDDDRISKAEMHEAVLKLMLSRREKLGGILIVPDSTLYPLDEERLATFSGWARDAGIWCFSERPRRKGDHADLVLEYVSNGGG